jgi:UDP-glucose 4-epimerase
MLRSCLGGVDVLFPFAAFGLPDSSNADPVSDVMQNLAEYVALFRRAAESGVRKIVFPSSGGTVYGIPARLPARETDPTDPISSHGILKLACEKYLALFERLHDVGYVALRYGNPYGVGQDPGRKFGAVAVFLDALMRGNEIEIWGDGSNVRDFLYVDDAMEATLSAVRYNGRARVFNIGSATGTSLLELIRLLEAVTGRTAHIRYRQRRKSDVPAIVLDIARAAQELRWTPTVGLGEGVHRTLRSMFPEAGGGSQRAETHSGGV